MQWKEILLNHQKVSKYYEHDSGKCLVSSLLLESSLLHVSSICSKLVQKKPWHSLQDDVHVRPTFLQEQHLSHISLQVHGTIFDRSLGPGSSSVTIGTNESFLDFQLHCIGSKSVSRKAFHTFDGTHEVYGSMQFLDMVAAVICSDHFIIYSFSGLWNSVRWRIRPLKEINTGIVDFLRETVKARESLSFLNMEVFPQYV